MVNGGAYKKSEYYEESTRRGEKGDGKEIKDR
jgi:hypothetical protein